MAKCVLDRISYWAHRFELAVKLGITFAAASNSFGQSTADRLKDLNARMQTDKNRMRIL